MTAYLSAHGISETFDICTSTARAIIKEIRAQVDAGRYPPNTILEGCGVRVAEDAVLDYMRYRKMLKRAPEYVPAFEVQR